MKIRAMGIMCCLLLASVPLPDVSGSAAASLLATKIALTPPAAFAGLITGVVGTVLGALSLKLHLGNMAEMEKRRYNGYGKRSFSTLQERIREAETKVDAFLDEAYRIDSSRCLEKLLCNVAHSRPRSGGRLSTIQQRLLEVARSGGNSLGFVSKRMRASMKAGLTQNECAILFDSCPFDDALMVSYIDAVLQRIPANSLP